MTNPHRRLADPWNRLPDHGVYAELAMADIAPDTPLDDIRERYFELMEMGMVSAETEHAYNELQVLPRRLRVDMVMYDSAVELELWETLHEAPEDYAAEKPLREQLRFAWEY